MASTRVSAAVISQLAIGERGGPRTTCDGIVRTAALPAAVMADPPAINSHTTPGSGRRQSVFMSSWWIDYSVNVA